MLESGLTYGLRLPSPTEVTQPEEPVPVVDHQEGLASSPKDERAELEADVRAELVKTSCLSEGRESRLPRPVSRAGGSRASDRRASSVQPNAAQSVDAFKSQTPPQYRKDSVQTGASQSTQTKDRYPRIRHMSKK